MSESINIKHFNWHFLCPPFPTTVKQSCLLHCPRPLTGVAPLFLFHSEQAGCCCKSRSWRRRRWITSWRRTRRPSPVIPWTSTLPGTGSSCFPFKVMTSNPDLWIRIYLLQIRFLDKNPDMERYVFSFTKLR